MQLLERRTVRCRLGLSGGAQEVAAAGRQIEEAVGALDWLSLGVRNWVTGVGAAR